MWKLKVGSLISRGRFCLTLAVLLVVALGAIATVWAGDPERSAPQCSGPLEQVVVYLGQDSLREFRTLFNQKLKTEWLPALPKLIDTHHHLYFELKNSEDLVKKAAEPEKAKRFISESIFGSNNPPKDFMFGLDLNIDDLHPIFTQDPDPSKAARFSFEGPKDKPVLKVFIPSVQIKGSGKLEGELVGDEIAEDRNDGESRRRVPLGDPMTTDVEFTVTDLPVEMEFSIEGDHVTLLNFELGDPEHSPPFQLVLKDPLDQALPQIDGVDHNFGIHIDQEKLKDFIREKLQESWVGKKNVEEQREENPTDDKISLRSKFNQDLLDRGRLRIEPLMEEALSKIFSPLVVQAPSSIDLREEIKGVNTILATQDHCHFLLDETPNSPPSLCSAIQFTMFINGEQVTGSSKAKPENIVMDDKEKEKSFIDVPVDLLNRPILEYWLGNVPEPKRELFRRLYTALGTKNQCSAETIALAKAWAKPIAFEAKKLSDRERKPQKAYSLVKSVEELCGTGSIANDTQLRNFLGVLWEDIESHGAIFSPDIKLGEGRFLLLAPPIIDAKNASDGEGNDLNSSLYFVNLTPKPVLKNSFIRAEVKGKLKKKDNGLGIEMSHDSSFDVTDNKLEDLFLNLLVFGTLDEKVSLLANQKLTEITSSGPLLIPKIPYTVIDERGNRILEIQSGGNPKVVESNGKKVIRLYLNIQADNGQSQGRSP